MVARIARGLCQSVATAALASGLTWGTLWWCGWPPMWDAGVQRLLAGQGAPSVAAAGDLAPRLAQLAASIDAVAVTERTQEHQIAEIVKREELRKVWRDAVLRALAEVGQRSDRNTTAITQHAEVSSAAMARLTKAVSDHRWWCR